MQRVAVLSLTIVGAITSGHAQDAVAQFYRGKTITIVVGLPAGGSYDLYARLFARYLGKYLPGEPNVIVSNMPGGGSNIAATYVARVAAKDGTYIAAPDATQPLGPILEGTADLNYDLSRVNYLGSASSDDDLPDVPLFLDLVKDNPEKEPIAKFMSYAVSIARPLATPPGVPADRVEILRRAFDATMKDPDFLADAARQRLDIDPLTGEQVQDVVTQVLGTPNPVRNHIQTILGLPVN